MGDGNSSLTKKFFVIPLGGKKRVTVRKIMRKEMILMNKSCRAVCLLLPFLVILAVVTGCLTGCNPLGRSNGSTQDSASSLPVDGWRANAGAATRVSFRVSAPHASCSGSATDQMTGSLAQILAQNPSAPVTATFRLILVNVGNDAQPTTILSKTVPVTSSGTAQVEFIGVPARTCVGELLIDGGCIGSYSAFHGAADLTPHAESILDLKAKGSNTREDVLARVILQICDDSALFRKSEFYMCASLEEILNGKNLEAASVCQEVIDNFTGASEFSIIIMPDTQNYLKYPNLDRMFFAQTEWIKANKAALNIQFVIHEGDVTDDSSPEQWQKARECMAVLDGVVPYAVCVGNHDILNPDKQDTTSRITEYFEPAEFAGYPWWGGQMPGEDCFWYRFQVMGEKFLVLSLGLGPSDAMLAWANSIVTANPDCKILMTTHSYVYDDGSLSTTKTSKDGSIYGKFPNGDRRNSGLEIWEKHVSKHSNYLMAFSWHLRGPAARNEMVGEHGNTVHQMLANYQYEKNGNGWLRILTFKPSEKKVVVKTYSPVIEEYWVDEENDFTLLLD